MSKQRPYVLSIAGFDPSGGAGVLADVKTFEANKVCGLGVVSALTVQNDIAFSSVTWITPEKIIAQVDELKKWFDPVYVKIGLVESLDVLLQIMKHVRSVVPGAKLIWDPILKASAGFAFHQTIGLRQLEAVCKEIDLITPNIPEAEKLGHTGSAAENAKWLSGFCHVFLKGGHSAEDPGRDTLLMQDGRQFSFRPQHEVKFAKHGSGCVLNSAIAANLARGYTLHRSCLRAKQYTTAFLNSNSGLLGYHKM